MPQSYSNVALHIIFSTKSHIPHLSNRETRTQLHAYLAGTCKAIGCPPILVGGWFDHVHILCFLARTKTISDLIKDLKIESSKWMKTKGPTQKDFAWQTGYAVYEVSDSLKDAVFEYIMNQ